ncbi:MAG TPA: hypothetical protein VK956_16285, partial [Verrucomicrobium sp.]|nr:hypothetical protein [Verrucomicrobium sp.]
LGLRSASSNAVGEHAKPAPGPAGRRPALRRKQIWLAVHRHDQSIYFKRLEHESYLMLNALRAGDTLADAVGVALEAADPAGGWTTRIQENFATWAELGWLCPFGESK